MIWIVAVVVLLFWPGSEDRSIAVKTVNWVADPMQALPQMPNDFTMADEDDIATVEAHDAQETAYEKYYADSSFARLRIHMRDMDEPFDPSTERQVLAAIAILAALLVWRLGGKATPRE